MPSATPRTLAYGRFRGARKAFFAAPAQLQGAGAFMGLNRLKNGGRAK